MSPDHPVRDLLSLSLDLWRADAEVADGAGERVSVVAANGTEVLVEPSEEPFRWTVSTRLAGETWADAARARFPRRHGSVAGMLRSVRLALDPDWRPGRARAALAPTLPDSSGAPR